MKILITGITGLFGSYLARKFAEVGQLHGLRRSTSDTRLVKDLEQVITWHEGDVQDMASLEDALPGMDLVIHAAGLVSYDSKDKNKLLEINTYGTANLVNAMLEAGNKKLIHVSSVAALGKNAETKKINEEHKWLDSEWNTPYAISKYLAELEVWRGVQEGLQVITVNPSVLLAKVADNRSSTSIYEYVLNEGSYYPSGSVNYIDIRDAADIVLRLYYADVWNENFIISKEHLPFRILFAAIAETLGKRPPSKKVTHIVLKALLLFSQLGRLFGSSLPLNYQTAMLSQLDIYMDNHKVQKLLDFQFTPLSDTLKWAFANENK